MRLIAARIVALALFLVPPPVPARPREHRRKTIAPCATSSGDTSTRERRGTRRPSAALFTAEADQLVSSGEWRREG